MSNRIIAAIDVISRYKILSGGTGIAAAASLPARMVATPSTFPNQAKEIAR
jgi:hypothetical protein